PRGPLQREGRKVAGTLKTAERYEGSAFEEIRFHRCFFSSLEASDCFWRGETNAVTTFERRLSYKGQQVDALGQRADEGRGARRYASGSCEQTVIRGYPNGATPHR